MAALVATLLALAALPAPAAGQAILPVGEAEGVRFVRERGVLVAVFTREADRLWRRVAGRRVSVRCEELYDPAEFGLQGVGIGETIFRAPKRGRRLWTGDLTTGMDVCSVAVAGRRPFVRVPLTQLGAVYLDERREALRLLRLVFISELVAEREGLSGYLTPMQFDARLPHIYLLSGPDDTPPPGRRGYWSDGARHVAVVTLSTLGRRLFLELGPDGAINTNVAGHIFGLDDPD